jgi:hypothetical protein
MWVFGADTKLTGISSSHKSVLLQGFVSPNSGTIRIPYGLASSTKVVGRNKKKKKRRMNQGKTF